ncbi:hypothetical protein JCM3774_001813 [Rhodotorula dairenensis]
MESFRQKLAHNSRVSLGPRDIKLLQECITSERKLVDQAQRLATERDKASHALREWAGAEGPDLNDVVSKVCTLYEYLSKAEMAYAEHNGNYRIRFKEIRSKEETLAGLKKSRDSLGGRIEAQDRKVSKMKEENKDLPAQKQRLRDMQQEMIGLEHSVLTEETRLGDFKRAATRAALSLKLGAMLELAEKTVIIAELGKLVVDMLPTDETEPGQPRAYYDGYSRTEELLSEAQRCLQDVVFNPAPITEGFAQHHGLSGGAAGLDGAGAGYPTDTYRSQLGHGEQPHQGGYGDAAGLPRDHFDEAGIRPVDTSNEYGASSPAARYRDEPSYGAPYETPHPHSSADAGVDVARHGGPQLQPLPDFRPISSFQPMSDDATNQWSDARRQPYQPEAAGTSTAAASTATPVHDAFASASRTAPTTTATTETTPVSPSALAPPVPDQRSAADRSSLAYMGSEPDYDSGESRHMHKTSLDAAVDGSDAEAREAAQARQDLARAERAEHDSDAYDDAANNPNGQTHQADTTTTDEYHLAQSGAAGAVDAPGGGPQQNPLSPIVEVATPAMTQVASPDPGQDQRDFHSSDYAGPLSSPLQQQQQPHVESPRRTSTDQYAAVRRKSYTPTAGSYAASPSAPTEAALYSSGEYSAARPRQLSAERPQGVSSPTTTPYGPPDVPTSPGVGSFEPRPISSRFVTASPAGESAPTGQGQQRRPIQIRPYGGEAGPLGSKYGDIQVASPGASSPRGGGGNASVDAGVPGYFGPSPSGNNEQQKRTLPAGAFRRPAPGNGGPASPGIGIGSIGAGGGSRQFSASGYQYDPNAAAAQQHSSSSSSESAAIAQRWRDSSVPPMSPEQLHQLEQAGEGEMPVSTPSFDVRPLQVHRGPRNGSVPRSGSVPPAFDAGHARSSSYNYSSAPSYDQASSPSGAPNYGPVVASSPNSHPTPAAPAAGMNGQDGFGSNRFVTRLD